MFCSGLDYCGLPVLLVTEEDRSGAELRLTGVWHGEVQLMRLTLRPHPCHAHFETSKQGVLFRLLNEALSVIQYSI